MTTPTLSLDAVEVRIGPSPVLRDVTLSVPQGSAVGLVGETGSGKSMTARVATGLLPHVRGRIVGGSVRLCGEELSGADDRAWRRCRGRAVALVPQGSMSSLDPIMPIGRQLEETICLTGTTRAPRAETVRLLRLVQLDGSEALLRSYAHRLSGGMRQRVMIALALAREPQLLVADEPTTALDASIRGEILALLTSLRLQHGLSMLLISHDISAIEAATDTVVVMYAGRTVETGPTTAVVAEPAHPYTDALIASRPERTPPGRPIPAIDGQPPAPDTVVGGCAFAARCDRRLDHCEHSTPDARTLPGRRTAACFAVREVMPR